MNLFPRLTDYPPVVISVDLTFTDYSDYEDDLKLLKAMNECKNLVMASAIRDFREIEHEHNFEGFIFQTEPHFLLNAQTGFTNAIVDESYTLRKFSVYEKVMGQVEYHLAVRTALKFDSIATMNFIKYNPKITNIDYKGGQRKFRAFSASDVLDGNVTRTDVEGKIVMLGFLGPGHEDKFFTPFSKNPKEPDMYGVEYLANIISQVLEYKRE